MEDYGRHQVEAIPGVLHSSAPLRWSRDGLHPSLQAAVYAHQRLLEL